MGGCPCSSSGRCRGRRAGGGRCPGGVEEGSAALAGRLRVANPLEDRRCWPRGSRGFGDRIPDPNADPHAPYIVLLRSCDDPGGQVHARTVGVETRCGRRCHLPRLRRFHHRTRCVHDPSRCGFRRRDFGKRRKLRRHDQWIHPGPDRPGHHRPANGRRRRRGSRRRDIEVLRQHRRSRSVGDRAVVQSRDGVDVHVLHGSRRTEDHARSQVPYESSPSGGLGLGGRTRPSNRRVATSTPGCC